MITLPRRPADWAALLLSALALVVLAAAVATTIQLARTALEVSSEPLRDIEILPPGRTPSAGAAGHMARGERMNILLLGYGGADVRGGLLTDSIMVVSIDPNAGAVTMISIPRDLHVMLPATKYTRPYPAKINEAFFLGAHQGDRDEGMRAADTAIEEALGITIHRTVAVDFSAFRAAVEALGGIEITVDRAFTALYPRSDDPQDLGWITIRFEAGPQHMDAETALRYTRARLAEGPEGSDFARAQRQQKVLLAVKDKVLSTSAVPVLLDLLDTLRENVRTDLSLADMQALAAFAAGHDDARTVRVALTDQNVLRPVISEEAGYILVPRAEGWADVHAFVRRALDFPASLEEDAAVVVTASSARLDVARTLARRLGELGIRATAAVATDPDPATSVVRAGSASSATADFIADYVGGRLESGDVGSPIVLRLGQEHAANADRVVPTPVPSASPTPDPEEEDGGGAEEEEPEDEEEDEAEPLPSLPPPPTGAP